MNAKKQDGSLKDWLLPTSQPFSDIYVVGFQEIVDLNAMNVAINSSNTIQKAQFWREKIAECLSFTKESYEFLLDKHLVVNYRVMGWMSAC